MSTPTVTEDSPFLTVTSWLYRKLYIVVIVSILATFFVGALLLSQPGGFAASAGTELGHTFRSLIMVVIGSVVGRAACWVILNVFGDDD